MARENSFRVLRNIKVELVCPVLYLKPDACNLKPRFAAQTALFG